jgi:transposase
VTRIICGVDVSSKKLDARIGREGRFARFGNNPEGIAALAGFCREQGVALVVMEATGGYEKKPFALLWSHGVKAALVNPRSVRRFAEAMGRLEKTDRIDSGMIAWFAESKGVEPMPPATETQGRLAALVVRLSQLTDLRTAQNNQRRLVEDPAVCKVFDELMLVITQQTRTLERQIVELIDSDPLWSRLNQAFRSIKGVADRTVARIMAQLPEIGMLSGKIISKLVGLAPIARDSGNTTGKRAVRGGRSGLRATLYLIALGVCKFDVDFAAFRDRLVAAGKPKKVVRTALAHKLLVRLNAKAREVRTNLAHAL